MKNFWVARKLFSRPQNASCLGRRLLGTAATSAQCKDNDRLRLGIIGSGPAGFYAAGRVMQKIPSAKIDMFERLPVPFGLVRYGVAPDHPEVKNCQEKFEEIAESGNFTFVGNVKVGEDISLIDLAANYDALIFAYGALEDNQIGIPGENLRGVISARSFVGWYNGLPEFRELKVDAILDDSENAVLVGQGNVALDVARILLADVDRLRKTDIAEHAIEALSRSRVKRVDVVGRRGPMQAAFTIKEVRELIKLPNVSFDTITNPSMPSASEIASLPRQQKRLAQLLAKGSSVEPSASSKSWSLKFLCSPSQFESSNSDPSCLGSVQLKRNRFMRGEDPLSRVAKVETDPQNEILSIATSLAFRSVGYKSRPLPGLSSIAVPFDDARGIIPNDLYGRVLAHPDDTAVTALPLTPTQRQVPGMYCAGWVKRGPTGVIASTMEDAQMTADALVSDWQDGLPFIGGEKVRGKDGWEGLEPKVLSLGIQPVSWRDWKRIDQVERSRGKQVGKVREKIVDVKDMLQALGS